jgi:uncharacterized damage-inducible protein DinB
MDPPQNPAGELVRETDYSDARRDEFIAAIAEAPAALRQAVAGLDEAQLDAVYRNWSIRQIVHHLADSHAHSFIRFKWALTEDVPTIKAYEEGDWVQLADSRRGSVAAALAMFEGLHAAWVDLLRLMTGDDYARRFHHPQSGKEVSLKEALCVYAWHSRHHTAQILWLRDKHGW